MHKNTYCTIETRQRMSEAHRGKSYKTRGYILDNRRTEPQYFSTLVEICDFLGYKKGRGFKMGNAYRGWIITRCSK